MTVKFGHDYSHAPFTVVAEAARNGDPYAVKEVARRLKPQTDLANDAKAARDLLIDLAVTPNGRPGDTRALARPGYKGKRRTSDYEREIAHALMRKGKSKGEAIRMARGLIKKAAATGRWGRHGKAGARTRAGAAASIAQRKTF
jgi:hypothetical protein